MDPAVAHEAEQVQAAPRRGRALREPVHDRVLAQGARLDLGVDAGDVHERDAPGAEVQVPDLAVAHLAGGQAHVGAARADEAVRVHGKDGVEGRGSRQTDGVVLALRPLAESVEDDENHGARSRGRGHGEGPAQ